MYSSPSLGTCAALIAGSPVRRAPAEASSFCNCPRNAASSDSFRTTSGFRSVAALLSDCRATSRPAISARICAIDRMTASTCEFTCSTPVRSCVALWAASASPSAVRSTASCRSKKRRRCPDSVMARRLVCL